MSPTSTDQLTLTGSQRRELTRLTRAGRTEQRLVTRAQWRASHFPDCGPNKVRSGKGTASAKS